MKKKLARLSRSLNTQTKKNRAIASFYTGVFTIAIIAAPYFLFKLIMKSTLMQYAIYGILIYMIISLLGAIVIVLLDTFFNK